MTLQSLVRNREIRLIACLSLSVLISGCGFQLAGNYAIDEQFGSLSIRTDDRYTPFYKTLVEELRRAGVEVGDPGDKRAAVLNIRDDETGQRVLSVSAQNVPREYEVFYTISYDVSVEGQIRSGADNLTLARDYTWTETALLGKAREEAAIRQALVDELVATVLRRLSYAEPK